MADLRRFMKEFRDNFEPMHPVALRQVDLKDCWGDTEIKTIKGRKTFVVRIDKKLSGPAQLFVLIHELAHTLQWRVNEYTRCGDHDAEWGIAYARIWEALLGD